MKTSKRAGKYHIITFGCQANIADSERVAGALEGAGMEKAAGRENADVIVFNTCSVRQKAEDRVFGLKKEIEKLKTANRKLKTVLTGCMMHYDKKELARRLPFVDIFLDIKETAKLPGLLGLKKGARRRPPADYLSLEPKYGPGISAGVPISYGCDNFCAYCIVPYSRNREYSRPVEDIVKEVRNLVQKEYKEIWLLGQNVNSYKSCFKIYRNSSPEVSAEGETSGEDNDIDSGGANEFVSAFPPQAEFFNRLSLPSLCSGARPHLRLKNSLAAEKASLKINPDREICSGCKKPCLHDSRAGCGNLNQFKNGGARSGGKVFCAAGTDSFEIKFPDLLRIINSIPGDFWIRFTSPHPKDFSDDLIKAMAECEKFAHYVNLPLQSGDNSVLRRMNRPYTAGKYKKLIAKIRKAMPDIAVSTDIIVGFPGETKKQFQNTAELAREIGFDMAYLSEYSSRPGTAAAKTMKDDVPHEEKERRKESLNKILEKGALKNNKKLVGKTLRVLNGKTAGHKSVKISGKYPKDEFISVKITGAGPWGLKGEIVPPKKMIVVLGPTASGKSGLAVELAREFNGEVISADSRQVYKGMDIGTGKISKKEMKGVPHHLIGVANPRKAFTAIDFKKRAEKTLEDIWSRGKTPIVCGGTGFYIQAITGGVAIPEVKPNPKLRAKLEKKTPEQLFKMLKKLDARRAETIDAKNPRRLIRAIEIARALGKVPKAGSQPTVAGSQTLFIGIKLPEKKLKEKVEKRMKQMLRRGLIKETEKLKNPPTGGGLSWKRIYELGFEYKYPAMFLRGETCPARRGGKPATKRERTNPAERERVNPAERGKLLERLIQSNLKYAKRQMTWFKKYAPETKWIDPSADGFREAEKLARKFL